jgi:hypothetical protein
MLTNMLVALVANWNLLFSNVDEGRTRTNQKIKITANDKDKEQFNYLTHAERNEMKRKEKEKVTTFTNFIVALIRC